MMIIASHRLASTWSRPSSTERRRRWWVTERALLKVSLESGTESELVRPSGHIAALAGPGVDRRAALSGAVPAAISGRYRYVSAVQRQGLIPLEL